MNKIYLVSWMNIAVLEFIEVCAAGKTKQMAVGEYDYDVMKYRIVKASSILILKKQPV